MSGFRRGVFNATDQVNWDEVQLIPLGRTDKILEGSDDVPRPDIPPAEFTAA